MDTKVVHRRNTRHGLVGKYTFEECDLSLKTDTHKLLRYVFNDWHITHVANETELVLCVEFEASYKFTNLHQNAIVKVCLWPQFFFLICERDKFQ